MDAGRRLLLRSERRRNRVNRAQEPQAAPEDQPADREELGFDLYGDWQPLLKSTSKAVYEKLIFIKYGAVTQDQLDKVNFAMTEVRGILTPRQREFWWKIAHRAYVTNDRRHHYVYEDEDRLANVCRMCHVTKETWSHMEYECRVVQEWLRYLRVLYSMFTDTVVTEDNWTIPTPSEWRLEVKNEMSRESMIVIAIARWEFHREWIDLNSNRRRRLEIARVAERVERTLKKIKVRSISQAAQ